MGLRARLAALVSVSGLLSCAIWAPGTSPIEAPVARVVRTDARFIPKAVEAHLVEHQTGLSPRERLALAHAIVESSDRFRVDVDMILAVIYSESGFHNFARSSTGALGLMQILPSTGRTLSERIGERWDGPRSLLDPTVNVRLGTSYLHWLHKRYGRWDRALAAYNFGPGAVDRMLRHGEAVPEAYASRVLSRFKPQQAPRRAQRAEGERSQAPSKPSSSSSPRS